MDWRHLKDLCKNSLYIYGIFLSHLAEISENSMKHFKCLKHPKHHCQLLPYSKITSEIATFLILLHPPTCYHKSKLFPLAFQLRWRMKELENWKELTDISCNYHLWYRSELLSKANRHVVREGVRWSRASENKRFPFMKQQNILLCSGSMSRCIIKLAIFQQHVYPLTLNKTETFFTFFSPALCAPFYKLAAVWLSTRLLPCSATKPLILISSRDTLSGTL